MNARDAIHVLRTPDMRPGAGGSAPDLRWLARGLGRHAASSEYLRHGLGMPYHLSFLAQTLAQDTKVGDFLASIPFYSLCRGLLMPLAGMTPGKAVELFGVQIPAPPTMGEREASFQRFLSVEIGLDMQQKFGCLIGDPFAGRPSRFRRESLMRLLLSERLTTRRELLDRLTRVGDVAVLFAESRADLQVAPPLTAAEVLHTLHALPDQKRNAQFDLLRSLLRRSGKVEAYFLAKLILGTVGLRYESELLARLIGHAFGVEADQVGHALALSDIHVVVDLLDQHGPDGLREIQLQPLVPVRPALAAGGTDKIKKYPAWVERKYDGIRLMLHKSTDAHGTVLCGAYTRNRRDYLELMPGLDATIKLLPAHTVIVDGELHGTVVGATGIRPATVYEVFSHMQGDLGKSMQLRYAGFDLIYLDGHDLTGFSLRERRQRLALLLGPLASMPTPMPFSMAEGQSAKGPEDVKRLYQHFRAQGYEGVIAKDLDGPYRLAGRDPSWRKRKPEVTLDLVLLGAVMAITSKENVGMFGSYILGARGDDGGYEDVGDVAGVDRIKDAEIQQLIMKDGLLNGSRIERKTVSGTHTGFELLPRIVVTVKMSGLVRDPTSGVLSLREPKLVVLRADKSAPEADSLKTIEQLYLRQQVG